MTNLREELGYQPVPKIANLRILSQRQGSVQNLCGLDQVQTGLSESITLESRSRPSVELTPFSGQALGIDDIVGGSAQEILNLAKKGLTTASWGETETGRRARFYSLTAAGQQTLAEERLRWVEYSEAVRTLLESPEG